MQAAEHGPIPRVTLLVGLPGVGKTTLAHALMARGGGNILSRDVIRDGIFPEPFLDYSQQQNNIATETLFSVLAYLLDVHRPRRLIIDGKPFSKAAEVHALRDLVDRHGGQIDVILCRAPLSEVKRRLIEGLADPVNVRAERTPDKAERIHQEFEPLDVSHLPLDMTRPLDELVDTVIDHWNTSGADQPKGGTP
ncbi:ATP-binding protein [Telmatospirillum sp.]|uniref:AAA family ATPase n=1 Tax=Telmatospirillum sp. TaxID=2079197 RepID=UPI00284A43F0|nr:ATP-binding protein [Telmatospirillum sp.]MDR3440127.1 ATP-binding protein [Telmatospirillum sp.]